MGVSMRIDWCEAWTGNTVSNLIGCAGWDSNPREGNLAGTPAIHGTGAPALILDMLLVDRPQ